MSALIKRAIEEALATVTNEKPCFCAKCRIINKLKYHPFKGKVVSLFSVLSVCSNFNKLMKAICSRKKLCTVELKQSSVFVVLTL